MRPLVASVAATILVVASAPVALADHGGAAVLVAVQGPAPLPGFRLEIGVTDFLVSDRGGVAYAEPTQPIVVRLIALEDCAVAASFVARAGEAWVFHVAADSSVTVEDRTQRGLEAAPALERAGSIPCLGLPRVDPRSLASLIALAALPAIVAVILVALARRRR